MVDWTGGAKPTADDLAGRPLLGQAKTRYDTITATGGSIIGERALELDGIEPMDTSDPRVGNVVRVWGRDAIRAVAEQAFVPRTPVSLRFFVDFPTRARADAAARKVRLETRITSNGTLWRLAVQTETVLPIDLAEGQYRDTARMLDGTFAGVELA